MVAVPAKSLTPTHISMNTLQLSDILQKSSKVRRVGFETEYLCVRIEAPSFVGRTIPHSHLCRLLRAVEEYRCRNIRSTKISQKIKKWENPPSGTIPTDFIGRWNFSTTVVGSVG